MQCVRQQPNQTGCWFSLPKKRQKHVTMVRPYPTRDTPTTTKSFGFYNLITLPNNWQAFVPKTKTKIQPTITIHNPYIYSTKQTSINTKMGKIPRNVPTWWASEIHFLRRPAEVRWNPLSSMSGRESAGSVESTREKSSESSGVQEGVGRSRESRSRGILVIRVLHLFPSQVHFRDFDFFLRLTMKWFKFFCLKYLSFSFEFLKLQKIVFPPK
jgi:hypothetical protein